MGIANKYPEQIAAIYIRNISSKKESVTLKMLNGITNENIYTCQFKHTEEAIAHARGVGLLR